MSYELIIRPEAELDIQDAFEWYEAQGLGLSSQFVRAVDACLSSVVSNPLANSIIYKQARRALIRRFPYGILYVFEPEIIAVIACFHGKRNPQSWQDKL